jgi:hypothetical protein
MLHGVFSEILPRILYQMYALHDTYAKCTLTPLYENPKCTPRARPSYADA